MLKLTPFHSLQQYLPHNLHLSLFQTCSAPQEVEQLHAFSLKTAIFNHPFVSSRLLALYSDPKINDLGYARSVFDRIQRRSLIHWNTIIKCYVENQFSHDGIVLFHELVHEYLPDNFTLPCVIKGCARLGVVQEGKQIHGLALKIGFGSDVFVQGSLVNMYSKCGEIDCARKVFDGMIDKDVVLWNSLIDGYARCGEIDIALQLFEEMPERDAFSWTVLVDGLSKCGKVESARKLFDQMPCRNLVSWNAMINGYMKSGDFDSALELFYQMPIWDLVTWNLMIAGYELNGQFMDAVKMFFMMLKLGSRPSHATLVSVLSAVSGLAVLGKGRWIHSYMEKNGFELDGILGTSLIEMYAKCGCIESALTVFRAIQKKKVGHWTAIIVGLGIHGLVDDGRRYFDMMMNEYKIEPTLEHYGCLVDILCRAGHLEEAKNTIENMPISPNKVIWMSLLGGSRNHGKIDIGEYAAQRVIEVAPETIGCYILLSNMYAASGMWEKVSHVREMMYKRGFRKDPGCSSVEYKGTLHEFIVGDISHPQTKEIYAKMSEMKEKLKCVGHVPDTTQVLLCIEGEKEKEAELENHSERLAIAFGLINVKPGIPIRIMKNLRVCNDCHSVTKLLSKIYSREIIVRDNCRFHHFKNGSCSCMDYW